MESNPNDRIGRSNKLAQKNLEEERASQKSVTIIGNPSTLINQDRQADHQFMNTLPRLPAIDIPLSKAKPNSFPDTSVPRKILTEPTSDTLINLNRRQSLDSITDLTTSPTPFSMKGGGQTITEPPMIKTTTSTRSSSKYYVDDKKPQPENTENTINRNNAGGDTTHETSHHGMTNAQGTAQPGATRSTMPPDYKPFPDPPEESGGRYTKSPGGNEGERKKHSNPSKSPWGGNPPKGPPNDRS